MNVAALIVAAGRGSRAGPGAPKQYRQLAGEPVLRRTLGAFAAHPHISSVLAVIHEDDREAYELASAGLPKLLTPCIGGVTRQASVRAGLERLAATPPDYVLIHDGARPMVSARLIADCISALAEHAGALAALAVTDTIRRATAEGLAGETVDRTGLWRAQTPQAFRFGAILDAHRRASGDEYTDDVAVAAAAGVDVAMVAGDEDNIKITSAEDIGRAERMIMRGGDVRTGTGFDVHRFGPGDHVWLCGVKVPHTFGLVGHSDADAGLHAITDAILGAIGAGDIGQHFPPSDPKWKGAPSDIFLAHAATLAREGGARISNVDLTLICEQPKIGPHVIAMRKRVAGILSVDVTRVSVKATTTEGLGFTGRGEGIAAQALATLIFG
ncbi:MAG: bifunctional 2-C-methyl-D-erythritol 4-phosphate cytidylyltransferase/2-C-methyl-D-erythritol 2,4-cyclodiphosphate synthase [Parvibaculum sp.]|uniref:bifunctional 2-C-methyl-D-erythritol 4-phosphate cytidylyltransferase/2-C-methyl-D-erythritol 2,4-cyclodiphosphate synthase n=1 Tax=Parvibaculum sp. TaxID=2024848 RepID=UPI002ABBA98D|nr:bifunctional 2-C-methyl-D-erythritol 4-phosphate cytidylyltransferase/2-C-methyl-D-erythritol 2,4-cyclodiphosphate synthase [Parvibaculum sp.]MDZ4381507.1 bifunctional 2-C-methyl-D-erythritol 4-phosphate cytidylyltransferase/2-C-methyl-D-erythritol 2,4-cyclodiphosphate synthase [Parvibaculum sp.]